MSLTYGSLFSGYGGLDLGVQSVLGGQTLWHCEWEAAPSKILAHHWPHVPNLHDVTTVDWASVPPVDVITGGSPCQDVSHAGKRAGMRPGTRSGLWASMCDAIQIIRPRLVVWENVRGVLSAEADSDLEPCAGCVGDSDDGPVLRAFGRVLGDLADIGYDASWYGLRAADVGAAHGRFRVFLFATPADTIGSGRDGRSPQPFGRPIDRATSTGGSEVPCQLMPTPDAYSGDRGGSQHPDKHRDGGHSVSIADVAENTQDWQQYETAIHRAEVALGRPAPSPTEPGKTGKPRLSPAFTEWLMMLPAGWVTNSVIGISRNDQLKALGNGVVPAQAAAATRAFLTDLRTGRAA